MGFFFPKFIACLRVCLDRLSWRNQHSEAPSECVTIDWYFDVVIGLAADIGFAIILSISHLWRSTGAVM